MRGSRFVSRYRRAQVYLRDGLRCRYCGEPVEVAEAGVRQDGRVYLTERAATLDHVDPAGGHCLSNLVTCCSACNAAKGCAVWSPGPHPALPPAEAVRDFRARYWPGQT